MVEVYLVTANILTWQPRTANKRESSTSTHRQTCVTELCRLCFCAETADMKIFKTINVFKPDLD